MIFWAEKFEIKYLTVTTMFRILMWKLCWEIQHLCSMGAQPKHLSFNRTTNMLEMTICNIEGSPPSYCNIKGYIKKLKKYIKGSPLPPTESSFLSNGKWPRWHWLSSITLLSLNFHHHSQIMKTIVGFNRGWIHVEFEISFESFCSFSFLFCVFLLWD